ncbi:MAG: class I SAM-dependent methyltransferase [Thermoplasmata archaeon]
MGNGGWEELADSWDAAQGDDGDLWHRTLIDPTFLEVVGDVHDQRVLDMGCGNGYIARKLVRGGADVTGIDASASIIAHAQRRETEAPLGIKYHVADAAHLDRWEDASFDTVVANMSLMDIEDAEGAIREAARLLGPLGRFVASLSHPCFDLGNRSAWDVERVVEPTRIRTTIWRKVSRYREPFHDRVPWVGPDYPFQTVYYHRPLSWYFRTLHGAGLVVRRLEEPAPTEEFIASESPQGPWIAEIPLHVVIEAVKWEAGTG